MIFPQRGNPPTETMLSATPTSNRRKKAQLWLYWEAKKIDRIRRPVYYYSLRYGIRQP
jgi:hypothetical protein